MILQYPTVSLGVVPWHASKRAAHVAITPLMMLAGDGRLAHDASEAEILTKSSQFPKRSHHHTRIAVPRCAAKGFVVWVGVFLIRAIGLDSSLHPT